MVTATRRNKPNPNKAKDLINKFVNDGKRTSVEMDKGFIVNHTAGAKWKSL